jgi:hypothetical protein
MNDNEKPQPEPEAYEIVDEFAAAMEAMRQVANIMRTICVRSKTWA